MDEFVGHSATGSALANTTILACLFDHLVLNGKLSQSEVLGILGRAHDELADRNTVSSVDAIKIIGKLQAGLAKEGI
jgi:hypothetical protein